MDSTKGVVTEFVSKNKWEKSKVIILQISVELSKGGGVRSQGAREGSRVPSLYF